MSHRRQKFATQVDGELLDKVRAISREEGRQLQALVEEALADLIEKRRMSRPRAHVIAAYRGSHARFASLYRNLAK
jgi:predicted Ser/Thr protein kinase